MKNTNSISNLAILLAFGLFTLFGQHAPVAANSEPLNFTNADLLPEDPKGTAPENDSVVEVEEPTTPEAPEKKLPLPNVTVLEAGVTAPYLWKVTSPAYTATNYLFGTIHIPDDRVTVLPDHVQKAYDNAAAVYTEIPMDIMSPANMLSQVGMLGRVMLPLDKKFTDYIDKNTENRVDAILQDHGYSLTLFNQMKVWVVAAQLGQLDLLEQISSGKQVLDQKLYMDAQAAGKDVGGLETAESQLNVFDTLTMDEQIKFLKETIDQIEEAKAKGLKPSEAVVDAYISGDTANIVGQLTETMDLDTAFGQKMYARLLVDRDKAMSQTIAMIMATDPAKSNFFAIGALHLPREEGVIGLLRGMGFTVERVMPEEK